MVVVLTMVNSFTTPSLVSLLNLHSLLLEADSYSLNLSTVELPQDLAFRQLFTQYSTLCYYSFRMLTRSLVLHPLSDSYSLLFLHVSQFAIPRTSPSSILTVYLSLQGRLLQHWSYISYLTLLAQSDNNLHNSPLFSFTTFTLYTSLSLWFLLTHYFSFTLLFSIDPYCIHRR